MGINNTNDNTSATTFNTLTSSKKSTCFRRPYACADMNISKIITKGKNFVFYAYRGVTGQMQMFQAQEVDKKIRKSIKREKKEQLFGRLETSWQHHEIGPFVVKRKEICFKILYLTKHFIYFLR